MTCFCSDASFFLVVIVFADSFVVPIGVSEKEPFLGLLVLPGCSVGISKEFAVLRVTLVVCFVLSKFIGFIQQSSSSFSLLKVVIF